MTISRTNLLQRIMKYCSKSERCTQDAIIKLQAWGVPEDGVEGILEKLYLEKFIDDKRYVTSYVTEKWNLDRWGKIKIANSLQQKNLDESLIEEALNLIDEEAYMKGLHELLRKKYKEVKSGNSMEDARRVSGFALSRGFEEALIWEWLEKSSYGEMPDAGI